MEVVPVIHIRKRETVSPSGRHICSTGEAVERLKEYKMIYLVDMDGIDGEPDLELLSELAKKHIWYDGGARNIEDVMDSFVSGAERVTVRHNLFRDVQELSRTAEDIYLGIEYRGKIPDVDVHNLPVVFIDVTRAGKKTGFDFDLIRNVLSRWKKVYLAGGLRLEDVPALSQMGAAGALIGTDILGDING